MLYRCGGFLSLLFCFSVAVSLDVSPLETWTLSDTKLTGNTRLGYSVYNGDSSFPECIFVFGGNVCTDCNTLFCYNITSDELIEFGSMDSSISYRYAATQQNGFIISDGNDDYLYYATDYGDIYYYDLNNPDDSDVLKTSIDSRYPGLVKNPDDSEFYLIDGQSSGSTAGEFYVYDLVEHEIHQGNDMNVARQRPGVVVNECHEDDAYIYVLGGYTGYIERISIKNGNARNNEWETLQLVLSNSISDQASVTISAYQALTIVSYANFMYLIGGYDGSDENDVFALDVANWEITWAGVFPKVISRYTASFAGSRVYTFGGYSSSSDTDDIYISNSFDEIIDDDEDDDNDILPLETWKLSTTTLTGNTRLPFSAWNGESNYPDCIFVFGGNVCTDCNTLFCYNITNDELIEFGSMDSSVSSRYAVTQQAAFIISDGNDDYLYYANADGDVYYYDLNNPDDSDVLKTSIDVQYPAMVKNPSDTEFYVIDCRSGSDSNGEFYVYDLIENEVHQGNDMNVARHRPGVVVNEYYDDAYIYVLGGYTSYMERLNLNDARNNKWETLQLLLSNSISDQCSVTISAYQAISVATYANFIYLIGGYDGSDENDIFALDVANWEINWAGVFPKVISRNTACLAEDRIYTFGGYSSSSDTDDIYISNSLVDLCDSSSSSSSSGGGKPNKPIIEKHVKKSIDNSDNNLNNNKKTNNNNKNKNNHDNNIIEYDNHDNYDLVHVNKGNVISSKNDNENGIDLNDYVIGIELYILFSGIYIFAHLASKCKNHNNNKDEENHYEYQSI